MIEHVWGKKAQEIIFFGGPSKSDLWCQILTDTLGMDVKVPYGSEATALGAAMCALVGVGVYSGLREASENAAYAHRLYHPKEANVQAYESLYPQWRAMNDHMLAASDHGLAPHMWVGAGAGA